MKFIKHLAIFLFAIAICLAGASYCLFGSTEKPNFVPNLLLNLVPEVLGVAAGTLITLYVAARLASEKFSNYADNYFILISKLRLEGKISGPLARQSMVVLVPLLNDKIMIQKKGDDITYLTNEKCNICGLNCEVYQHGTVRKCKKCGLKAKHWAPES
jgi:hypothetical protein